MYDPATEQRYWQAVEQRDHAFDGVFVVAVRTTRIYCRPICPARRPYRQNVEFFPDPDAAERAGYRACLRCRPREAADSVRRELHRDLIAGVCRYLEQPHERLPTLNELAKRFAISPFHLQRTFKRMVGVSPRQYADAHRQRRVKAQLQQGGTVTDALYASGYGSSSGFYAGAAQTLGMTPRDYRGGGGAVQIAYTITPCPLGKLLVAATERGVCKVSLGDNEAALVDDLRREYPAASIQRAMQAEGSMTAWVEAVVDYLSGQPMRPDLPLDIRATAFQHRVWAALQAIPYGETRTYSQIAREIGQPTAARAVAGACAANPTALIIPCHRVVREDGMLGGYRWGIERKEKLLATEAENARAEREAV